MENLHLNTHLGYPISNEKKWLKTLLKIHAIRENPLFNYLAGCKDLWCHYILGGEGRITVPWE